MNSTAMTPILVNSTIIEDNVIEDNENTTIISFEKETRTYIYEGGVPPSYWDSPISASQLIVTCILLIILCGIYTYSNFDSNKRETPLLKPGRNQSMDAKIENRLQQLENNRSTGDWQGELSVTREKLERIIQWLNSCPSPGNFQTFKHCQENEV
ncbi:unnamed protein product [Allacma fusca]|uniref:Uncharacterized protein n=1 Tax=Allacma fusca TaxID=39272 RepID=A0A8J2NN31_9HEXA|nr:unnamed protein product [Allacma fusca]